MDRSGLYIGLKKRVEKGFLTVAPYGRSELADLTGVCLQKSFAICSVTIMLILIINFLIEGKVSHLSLSLIVMLAVILLRELPEIFVSRKYETFQKDMLQYLSSVKARYIYSKSVLEAIDSASYDFSPEVQKNAAEIMKIMLSGHRRERVKKYIKDKEKDRYLKLFLIQAHETSENGDCDTADGESLFCRNIDILRTEIMKGIYERKKKNYMFSGYLFVAVFPVLMIPLVQKTGLALSRELDVFYLGTGNFIVILAYVALFAVYSVVKDFKGESLIDFGLNLTEKEYYEVNPKSLRGRSAKLRDKINDNPSKRLKWLDRLMEEAGVKSSRAALILRCLAIGTTVFGLGVVFLVLQQNAERKVLTQSIGNIDEIAIMANANKKEAVERSMLYVINLYKDSTMTGAELTTAVEETFTDIAPRSQETLYQAAVGEIVTRIMVYRGLYLHWYQIFVLDVIAFLAGLTPLLQLFYKGYRRREGITEEVKRLQNVVIMERGLANISTCELLENMEMFADVFRENIQDALNLYQAGAENALSVLRDRGGQKSYEFKELAEGFMAISDVGVYQAFSSVEADRRGLEIMTELSEEIMISGKKNLMDVFSWIPGVIVMMGYLIVPFLRIAMADLNEVFSMMDGIQMF